MPVLHVEQTDGRKFRFEVPDGKDELPVIIRKCKHCEDVFTVRSKDNSQIFFDESHEREWRNDQRPRKTSRRQKLAS